MKYLDFNNYREFKIEDLFEVLKGRNKFSKSDLNENGKIPLYSSTEENNGILGYTNKKPDYKIDNKNIFYVIFGDHTRTMFVAKKDFCVMDNVKVLMPKIYNENAIKFILTVWKSNIPNLGYSRHWSVAKNIKIKLPVDQSGQLDLYYMEDYMNNIENKVKKSLHKFLDLTNNFNKVKIDTNNWVDFQLGKIINKSGKSRGAGIFNILHSVAYHNKDVEEINASDLNYVTRSKFNNGIKFKVIEKEDYVINPSGTISFGAENANFFYQENKYITGNKMYYIDTRHLSKNCAIFLKTILEATFTNNFSYSDAMTPERIYDKTIKLPVNENADPDWDYMDKYISNINDKVKRKLDVLDF